MPTHVQISKTPTAKHVQAIQDAAAKGDVIVVSPRVRSKPGRNAMRRKLREAGLAPDIAGNLGWATEAPQAPQPTTPLAPPPTTEDTTLEPPAAPDFWRERSVESETIEE